MRELADAWAALYPLIHWVVVHPVASLMLALLGLYLIWLLLRGLIYLTEKFWVRLLQLPLWLLRSLWAGRQFPPFLKKGDRKALGQDQTCDRLQDLINQLETTQQQQQQLLNLVREELQKINER